MSRVTHTLLFLTLILGACSPNISSPQTIPAPDHTPSQSPATEPATEVSSSINTCGYQWAYENLPELTAQFDQAVKGLIPNSTSHATAFGENCIGNDGQVIKFLAMETDFYILVSVDALDDYETFGNWIAPVMQVVNALPANLIAGPKPGFVEFRFEKTISESIAMRVPIQQYNETANGINGEKLFHMFYTAP